MLRLILLPPSFFSISYTAFVHYDDYVHGMKGVLEKEFHDAEALEDGGGKHNEEHAAELEIQDAVFMNSYIPRTLYEVM